MIIKIKIEKTLRIYYQEEEARVNTIMNLLINSILKQNLDFSIMR
jgi:hypothetical protein